MKLANVKLGDVVAYDIGGFRTHLVRGLVDRVTPAQFCCGSVRFRKSDGAMVGTPYRYAELWTDEHDRKLAEQEQRLTNRREFERLISRLGRASTPNALATYRIAEMHAVLDAAGVPA